MNQKNRILLIEDEEETAALIKLQAENMGYQLHVEVDGINGFKAIEREKPDLVILDIMLPRQNGFNIVRKIKKQAPPKKINAVILSEKNEELDIILGLELGADDYLTKPFSVKILLSKIKAILRRKTENIKPLKNINFSEYTLEIDKYTLKKGSKEIPLTLSEFGILKRLLTNKNQVLSRAQLIDDINNDDAFIVDRNIDVHVAALRKKLGSYSLIETVRGIGYRYKEPQKI